MENHTVNELCVEKFDFMAIYESEGLNSFTDGILGLGPNQNISQSLFTKMYDKKKLS